ncbi:MAG: hypothetical protein ACYC51_02350 [Thermoleophilia bacterium]
MDSFADYSGPGVWSVTAAQSVFGFRVNDTTGYTDLTGTMAIQIHSYPSETAGESTNVNFKAEAGASHLQPIGN